MSHFKAKVHQVRFLASGEDGRRRRGRRGFGACHHDLGRGTSDRSCTACVSCSVRYVPTHTGSHGIRWRLCHKKFPFLHALQGTVSPCKGRDRTLTSGVVSSTVQRSPVTAAASVGGTSRSIAIPSVNRCRPIVPCHGSVEGFNQVATHSD